MDICDTDLLMAYQMYVRFSHFIIIAINNSSPLKVLHVLDFELLVFMCHSCFAFLFLFGFVKVCVYIVR